MIEHKGNTFFASVVVYGKELRKQFPCIDGVEEALEAAQEWVKSNKTLARRVRERHKEVPTKRLRWADAKIEDVRGRRCAVSRYIRYDGIKSKSVVPVASSEAEAIYEAERIAAAMSGSGAGEIVKRRKP